MSSETVLERHLSIMNESYNRKKEIIEEIHNRMSH